MTQTDPTRLTPTPDLEEGVVRLDLSGRVLEANPAARRMFSGSPPEEERAIIGADLRDLLPAAREWQVDHAMRPGAWVINLSDTLEVIARLAYSTEQADDILLTLHPVRGESLRHLFGYFNDIFDPFPDCILLTNAEGLVIKLNTAFQTVLNRFGTEMEGLSIFGRFADLLSEEQRAEVRAAIDRGGSFRGIRLSVADPEGVHFEYEADLVPLVQFGVLEGYFLVAHNITEHLIMQQRLRRSDNLYRSLVEESRDVIFHFDVDERITYINPAVRQFGYDHEAIVGESYVRFIHPDDLERVHQEVSAVLARQREEIDFRFIDAEGKTHFVHSVNWPVYLDRNLTGFHGVMTDISSMVAAEENLARRAAQLELLNDIGQQIVSFLDLDKILQSAVNLLQEKFGYYHVALYRVDWLSGEAVMAARAGSLQSVFPPDHRLTPGRGIVGWVTQNHRTLLANDVAAQPIYYNPFPNQITTRSELAVPVMAGEELLGVLDLQSPTANSFSDEDVQAIEAVASQLAIAIENARLFEETRRQVRQREQANEMVRMQRDLLSELNSVRTIKEAAGLILENLKRVPGVDVSALFLNNEKGDLLLVSSVGLSEAMTRSIAMFSLAFPLQDSLDADKPTYLRFSDLDSDKVPPQIHFVKSGLRGLGFVPVKERERSIALLAVASREHNFIPSDSRVVIEAVAGQIGAVLVRLSAQQALVESETRTRALVEAIPDTLYVLNGKGEVLELRRGALADASHRPDIATGKKLEARFPREVSERIRATIRQVLENGQIQQIEYKLASRGESARFFTARIAPMGENRLLMIEMDVTAQETARVELNKRQRIYRDLFENTRDGVMMIAPDKTIFAANPRLCQLLGYLPEELIGQDQLITAPDDELDLIKNRFELVSRGEVLPVYESNFVRKDGSSFPAEASATMLFDDNGQMLHCQVIVRDITDRKAAEEQRKFSLELEKTAGRISAIFFAESDMQQVVPLILALAGKAVKATRCYIFEFSNQWDLATSRYEWAEEGLSLLGLNTYQIRTGLYPNWLQRLVENQPVIYPGETPVTELELASMRVVGLESVLLMPLQFGGKPWGFLGFGVYGRSAVWSPLVIGFARNVSEMLARSMERSQAAASLAARALELQEANERLLELDRVKSQFLANMSHELRTPLNSILGFSEVMVDGLVGELSPDQKEYLEHIHASGVHLLNLINDLLDFSRIQARRIRLEKVSFSARDLLEESVASMMPLAQKANQSLTLILDVDPGEILADRTRLKQVLLNLLSNAVKFTPNGGAITLTCGRAGQNSLLICVNDTGPGIRPEDQEIIFEGFRQVDMSMTRAKQGAGLGLAISRELVELHGGKLWVESQPGKGASFYLLLPVV